MFPGVHGGGLYTDCHIFRNRELVIFQHSIYSCKWNKKGVMLRI